MYGHPSYVKSDIQHYCIATGIKKVLKGIQLILLIPADRLYDSNSNWEVPVVS